MPEYRKPGAMIRVMNSAIGVAIKLGLSPQGGQLLTVRGRKSGKPMSTPVNPMTFNGNEYLVAPRGDCHWTRNLRVAGTAQLRLGRKRRTVRVDHELAEAEKPPVLLEYLRRWSGVTKAHFGITWPNPTAEEVERVCARTPMFQLTKPEA
ncbi:MAG: nitroreductase family deazaflavin-dependent oxidoreductase [Dehalococcoidia bacterium]|nr:nitroreductase family deazaflavin-dependent oxidoreductase [Dehalococcoidia bacterium]